MAFLGRRWAEWKCCSQCNQWWLWLLNNHGTRQKSCSYHPVVQLSGSHVPSTLWCPGPRWQVDASSCYLTQLQQQRRTFIHLLPCSWLAHSTGHLMRMLVPPLQRQWRVGNSTRALFPTDIFTCHGSCSSQGTECLGSVKWY